MPLHGFQSNFTKLSPSTLTRLSQGYIEKKPQRRKMPDPQVPDFLVNGLAIIPRALLEPTSLRKAASSQVLTPSSLHLCPLLQGPHAVLFTCTVTDLGCTKPYRALGIVLCAGDTAENQCGGKVLTNE